MAGQENNIERNHGVSFALAMIPVGVAVIVVRLLFFDLPPTETVVLVICGVAIVGVFAMIHMALGSKVRNLEKRMQSVRLFVDHCRDGNVVHISWRSEGDMVLQTSGFRYNDSFPLGGYDESDIPEKGVRLVHSDETEGTVEDVLEPGKTGFYSFELNGEFWHPTGMFLTKDKQKLLYPCDRRFTVRVPEDAGQRKGDADGLTAAARLQGRIGEIRERRQSHAELEKAFDDAKKELEQDRASEKISQDEYNLSLEDLKDIFEQEQARQRFDE